MIRKGIALLVLAATLAGQAAFAQEPPDPHEQTVYTFEIIQNNFLLTYPQADFVLQGADELFDHYTELGFTMDELSFYVANPDLGKVLGPGYDREFIERRVRGYFEYAYDFQETVDAAARSAYFKYHLDRFREGADTAQLQEKYPEIIISLIDYLCNIIAGEVLAQDAQNYRELYNDFNVLTGLQKTSEQILAYMWAKIGIRYTSKYYNEVARPDDIMDHANGLEPYLITAYEEIDKGVALFESGLPNGIDPASVDHDYIIGLMASLYSDELIDTTVNEIMLRLYMHKFDLGFNKPFTEYIESICGYDSDRF